MLCALGSFSWLGRQDHCLYGGADYLFHVQTLYLFTLRPGHRLWTAKNKGRLLREFYAIVGFERFKTRLRIRIDPLLRGFTWFLRCLRRSHAIHTRYCADYKWSFRHIQPFICPVWGLSVPMRWSAWFINAWSMRLRPGHTGPNARITNGSRTIPDFCASFTRLQVLNGSKLCFAYRSTCL